jgi:membrane protease YdiL (CAAX protease family)
MAFGLIHANVWPTPVPLFIMGLIYGEAAAISGRILPTVVAHGLFNAISTILVLRGQA